MNSVNITDGHGTLNDAEIKSQSGPWVWVWKLLTSWHHMLTCQSGKGWSMLYASIWISLMGTLPNWEGEYSHWRLSSLINILFKIKINSQPNDFSYSTIIKRHPFWTDRPHIPREEVLSNHEWMITLWMQAWNTQTSIIETTCSKIKGYPNGSK